MKLTRAGIVIFIVIIGAIFSLLVTFLSSLLAAFLVVIFVISISRSDLVGNGLGLTGGDSFGGGGRMDTASLCRGNSDGFGGSRLVQGRSNKNRGGGSFSGGCSGCSLDLFCAGSALD